MTTGQWVLVVAVVAAVAFGVWRARTDGRFRTPAAGAAPVEAPTSPAAAGAAPVEADAKADAKADVEVGERVAVDSVLAGTPFADQLGEKATFVQFSSAFCAPCRVTRRTLEEVVEVVPGVAHVEVDAELHLELVRKVDVLRTPTTLVLDASGREVTRAAGAPTKQQVLTALAMVVPSE